MPRFAMVATETIDRPQIKATRGAILHVSPIEAAMLVYQREARFATAEDLEPPTPQPEPEPLPPAAVALDPQERPRRRRRTYRTRELKANR